MQVSHSRIETFKNCPYKFKLQYHDELKTLKPDEADNALFLGTALHTGIEKGVETALQEYFNQYPVITDFHINEAMKLEVMIPKAVAMLPKGLFEVKIEDEDFKGFIDLLVPVEEDIYDIYDFKYSNNVSHYKESVQVHLYKYYFEKQNPGKRIRNLYYLCVPKVGIRQKKTEDLYQFRQRLLKELTKAEPQLVQVEYDPGKVIDWMLHVKHAVEAEDFPQNKRWLCGYCEFKNFCERNEDYMLLPKNERRNINEVTKKVVWIYGAAFSGKTTFANSFPDPLLLNTDGNIKFVDAPYVAIKDRIESTGRSVNKTFAWDAFKEVIEELEKKDNDFKTIVVDLLEDTYEYCRLWMYNKMGITHESDDGFRAWDKIRTEFLSTLKRLMALDYENIILISHEDSTKDITKKGGDKLTSIKPNLPDKVSNKVAGMVDIVARVIADENRVLSFKTNEVIFGGGRLATSTKEIPLDYKAFLKVYAEANGIVASSKGAGNTFDSKETTDTNEVDKGHINENIASEQVEEPISDPSPAEDTPKTRTRRTRKERE